MKTYILLPRMKRGWLPEEFHDDDVRSSQFLVKQFIEHFTQPGDTVFDPFAGFGTTLLVAERMKRIPFGIEADERRYEFTRSKLTMKDNIIHGDSRKLDTFPLPSIDFVFTSPIFMGCDETKNPLSGFKENGNYQVYLDQIQDIFRKLSEFLNPDARVVVEVFNLAPRRGRPMTLLAWDITHAISKVLRFEKEIIACWTEVEDEDTGETPMGVGYDHHYCLVF
ncbi:MAG: DNA methyltransferase, partial [Candidatus Thorarchaeota archaeon]